MSQQLQITGGAKVRSLEGVITGSTGVLGSLPINGANGIPQLDSNGKILVSQLPNSVMEYLGTWNVTTNTPYLVNGTGNAGDVYLVEGAATGGTSHDFGAGAITFYNGDQVIYSGSIWQRGAGSSGTVTSVAITESGDALTITGSPITNSGTINIGFAGTSAQYVAGNGTLVTFPTITTEAQRLITEVYNETGATLTKGTVVYINGGHGNLPTIAKALATSDATSAQTYGVVQSDIGNNNNGYVVVIGSLTDLDTQAYSNGTQLYLSPTTAGAWTSTKQYAPAHLVYVGIVTRSHPTQGVVEIKIQNGYELDELHNVSAQTPSNNDGLFYNSSNSLWENKSIATALGYTPVSGSGTTNYIPKFTGSTSVGNSTLQELSAGWLQLGSSSINTSELDIEGNTGAKVFLYDGFGGATIQSYYNDAFTILTQVSGQTTNVIDYNYVTKTLAFQTNGNNTRLNITSSGNIGIGNTNDTYKLDVTGTGRFSGQLTLGSTITNGTYTYTLPGATGTLALTSDIPSLSNYVTLDTTQTITAYKTFTGYSIFTGVTSFSGYETRFNSGVSLDTTYSVGTLSGYTTLGGNTNGLKINTSDGGLNNLNFASTTSSNTYTLPNATGTIALTTDLSSYVPTSRTLTINGTTYDLSANRAWTISGTSQWTTTGSDIYYNTGKVGIGTSTPSGYLMVKGDGSLSNQLRLAHTTDGYFDIGVTSSVANLIANYNTTAIPMAFYTGAAERMRISTTGNVSIGNTNNTYKLDVSGTIRATGLISANAGIKAQYGRIDGRLFSTSDAEFGDMTSTTGCLSMSFDATGQQGYLTSRNYATATDKPLNYNASSHIFNGGKVSVSALDGESLKLQLATSTGNNYLRFYSSGGTALGYVGSFDNSGTQLMLVDGSGTDLSLNGNANLLLRTGGTERMRIVSAGNVCIGMTSSAYGLVAIKSNGSTPYYGLNVYANGNGNFTYMNHNNNLGIIGTEFGSGGTGHTPLTFQVGASERMRITTGGAVLIGTTTDPAGMPSINIGGSASSFFSVYNNYSGSAVGLEMTNSSNVLKIQFFGSSGNYYFAGSNLSDRRLKSNIIEMNEGLSKIIKLKPSTFTYDKNPDIVKGGFIAQEVLEVMPEFVTIPEDENEMMGVDYFGILALAVKAIQELKAEIDELKNK